MKAKQDKPGGTLQADPRLYKRNSVMGTVTAGGKAVPGATVTIVATGESFPVESGGSYIVVLEPAKLGLAAKELLFAAPGYVEQRRTVSVPENKHVRLDVELSPAK